MATKTTRWVGTAATALTLATVSTAQAQDAPPAGAPPAPSRVAEEWASDNMASGDDLPSRFAGLPPGYAPRTLASDGGAPPRGYVAESEPREEVWITGAGVFGGAYLISALTGGLFTYLGGGGELFVPLAGPWLALPSAGHDTGVRAFLIINGVAQLGGSAMFVGGFVFQRDIFVRTDRVGGSVRPPSIAVGPGSVDVRGAF